MKIGDVLPLPADVDLDQARVSMRRRYNEEKLNSVTDNSRLFGRLAIAKRLMVENQTAERKRHCPVEKAKAFLRQKGFRPVATLDGVHIASQHRFSTDQQLFEFASEKGWVR